MSQSDQKQSWRSRLGWLASQLLVIFIGVTAAFVVENYRETLSQREEVHQAVTGITSSVRFNTPMLLMLPLDDGSRRIEKDAGLCPATTAFPARRIRRPQPGTARLPQALREC
jgi:hypothetical protein